jgi:hypothetical protein
MNVLDRLATSMGVRSEVPNQQLARELAESHDQNDIRMIAEHLWDKDPNIASDCLKVLYELGMIKPELVADYYDHFIRLLKHRNNRMVWGAMIALATIARNKPDDLFLTVEHIKSAMQEGSVITLDNGVKTLALIGSTNINYENELLPFLLEHLRICRAKDVPQHAEHTAVMISPENQTAFIAVLKQRFSELTPTGQIRINKIIKKLGSASQ